jgi:HAD superfamily hydrolase (TIGR01458 family)
MSEIRFDDIRGVLCDIDGVIWESQSNKEPTPGAHETIRYIKDVKKLPMRFVTNTTTRSLDTLYNDIHSLDFPIRREEIVSPPVLAVEWLRRKGKPSVYLVMGDDTAREFDEFPRDDQKPDFIVIGNYGHNWNYDLVNRLFLMLLDGSELLALHKQRFWHSEGEIQIDIGCWVTGLEYSSARAATAIGKPEELFFRTALDGIDVRPEDAIMIGDDIETDIGGAKNAGLRGVLVRTGKFRDQLLEQSQVKPDLVINALGDLREYL